MLLKTFSFSFTLFIHKLLLVVYKMCLNFISIPAFFSVILTLLLTLGKEVLTTLRNTIPLSGKFSKSGCFYSKADMYKIYDLFIIRYILRGI